MKTMALLCVLLLVSPTPQANAQIPDPLGGLALGAAFKVLGDKVNEAIERATGAGVILLIQAGGQAALVIQQAQAAFEHQSKLFWNDLNAAQQSAIGSVYSLANDVLNRAFQNISEIEARAQGIVNSLPLSKTFPQVWRFSPSYAEASGVDNVPFMVTGNFFDVPRKGFDAELILNGSSKPYTNAEKGTGSLKFLIPRKDLKAASATTVANNSILIRVPYRKGIFGSKAYAEFKSSVGSLPTSIGTITSTITTTKPDVAVRANQGPEDRQDSKDDDIICGGEHADLAIHLAYPTASWRIQPSSVTWQLLRTEGDRNNDWDDPPRNCSTLLVACLCVNTRHKNAGTSGKLWFRINFVEEKDIEVSTPSTDTVNLGWGEQRVITIPPVGATWTGKYTRFDGKSFDIPPQGYKDDFILVTRVANTITITSAPHNNVNLTKMQEVLQQKLQLR